MVQTHEKPIIVLGAGATKACGGPLTDDILPAAPNGEMAHDDRTIRVSDREELLHLTREFLRDCFNVPLDGGLICYKARTGERLYLERLASGRTGFSASPVAANGKLYFTSGDR